MIEKFTFYIEKSFQTILTKHGLIPIESISELVKRIEEDGKISKIDASVAKNLLSTPLKCHRCHAMPKTIPDLKSHLLQHLR